MTSAVTWTIVVGAGTGSRFGGPKQLHPCAGRRVIDWSAAVASDSSSGVVLVLPEALVGADGMFMTDAGAVRAVAGGASRSESVRAGLAVVPENADIILVHDAARPAADRELFARVRQAVVDGADAAIPVIALVDTIRSVDGGVVDRSQLVAVQTPQGFRAEALRDAHRGDGEATDDASLVEQRGGVVVHVDGSPENLKITSPVDAVTAEAILQQRFPTAATAERSASPTSEEMS